MKFHEKACYKSSRFLLLIIPLELSLRLIYNSSSLVFIYVADNGNVYFSILNHIFRWATHLYVSLFPSVRPSVRPLRTISLELYII